MTDLFDTFQPGLESPPLHATPVTPSDTTDLAIASRAINVAQSGTVRVTTIGGDLADLYVAAGIAFPVRCSRIWATGTDATGIVSLC